MKRLVVPFLLLALWATATAVAAAEATEPPRVTLTDKTSYVVIDNGIISVDVGTEWNLEFDAAMLKPGSNTITLEQQGGNTASRNVMYDCLRLEIPETIRR